jgi:hypothetical protein
MIHILGTLTPIILIEFCDRRQAKQPGRIAPRLYASARPPPAYDSNISRFKLHPAMTVSAKPAPFM